jgi:serine phosphatase RsbU (regulator of sigma subunit)
LVIAPPDGEPYFLKAKSNLAVGLFEDFPYQTESIDLKPGTRIVAYTDGVTEAENAALEQYGDERLLQEVSKIDHSMDNKTAVDQIYSSVLAFADGNPQNDDITIISLTI